MVLLERETRFREARISSISQRPKTSPIATKQVWESRRSQLGMTSTGLDSFWYAYWKVGVRSRISLLLLSLIMTMRRRRLNTIEYIFFCSWVFWHLKKKKELRLWNINQISLFEATWHLTTKLLDSGSWFIFLSSQCLDRKCSREIVSFSLIQFVSLWAARSSLVAVFVHAQVECTSAYYDHYWTLLPCFIDLPFHTGRKFAKYVFMFHSKWHTLNTTNTTLKKRQSLLFSSL